jgi:hypothetical protein
LVQATAGSGKYGFGILERCRSGAVVFDAAAHLIMPRLFDILRIEACDELANEADSFGSGKSEGRGFEFFGGGWHN